MSAAWRIRRFCGCVGWIEKNCAISAPGTPRSGAPPPRAGRGAACARRPAASRSAGCGTRRGARRAAPRRAPTRFERIRLGASTHSTGARHLLPAGAHLLVAVEHRVDDLVRGIAAQHDALPSAPPGPSAARGSRPCPATAAGCPACSRSASAAKLSYGRKLRRRRAARRASARSACGACSGRVGGMPKPSRLTKPRDALRPHAGIERGDVAAEAVADEVDRRFRLDLLEQRVQVGDVVGEPVAVGLSPVGQAVAAPVRRIHVPVRAAAHRPGTGTRPRRPSSRAAAPASARRARCPAPHVVAQAADLEELRLALPHVNGKSHLRAGGRETRSASALPEPQASVQPSVPCPVFRKRLRSLVRPMTGTLLGVAGRRPVQLSTAVIAPSAREELADAARDRRAAHRRSSWCRSR